MCGALPKRGTLFSLPPADCTNGTQVKATNKADNAVHTRFPVKITYTLFVFSVLFIVFVYVLVALYSDITAGGNDWRQGDWLINNEYQLVRRGIFGSLVFSISDHFLINPLLLVVVTQGSIVIVIFLTIGLSVVRLEPNTRVLWLILSPAFVLIFWFNDIGSSCRKEILVYFSYSLLLLSIVFQIKNKFMIWIASLFFIFAVFSHEGNFLFLIFFIISLYIVRENLSKKQWYLLVSIVIIGSLGGLGYAIAYSESIDSTFVCRALLQRGLSEHLCNGAIFFLDQDIDHAVDFLKSELLDSGLYIFYIIAYCLSLIPLLFVRPLFLSKKVYFLVIIFGIMLFSPLFAIAIDWGRWINFYVTSMTMILLMHMNLRPNLYPFRELNTISFKLIVFLHSTTWNVPRYHEVIGFGVVDFAKWVAAKLLGSI